MLNKNTKKSKKGFTLTEVLVVVLIIGVISAIAYPVYTKSINKSRAVEAINLLEMVRNKQIANFARRGEYLPTFKDMGQLTSNAEAEIKTEGDAILTVNGKYELAMNNATNCMSAAYIPAKGKPATFTFSSSYEQSGLGCDGDICKTFGNIVGSSSSVCNCGTKTCSSPYVQNAKTCVCDCPLACTEGGCHDKNPARTETRNCGYNNSGTQTRVCPESCSSECNTSWSSCSGQSCNEGTKPDTTQNCANCGQKSQSVTCENGSWKASGFGACIGSKTDTQACDSGYTGNKTRTCTNDVWGAWNTSTCIKKEIECEGSATANCENCGTKTRTCDKSTGTWGEWSGCVGTLSNTLGCDDGATGYKIKRCKDNVWGEWDTSHCLCTPSYGSYSANETIFYHTLSQVDTCNKSDAEFKCSASTKGVSCRDYTRAGTCYSGSDSGYKYSGTYGTYSMTVSGQYPSKGRYIESLGPTIRDKIKSGETNPQVLCKYLCESNSNSGFAAMCGATTLIWHYNGLGNPCGSASGGTTVCKMYELNCDAVTDPCIVHYRDVKCC